MVKVWHFSLYELLSILKKRFCLVVAKNPADFVGAVIGASELNTKAILANSVGKVLIIDEVRCMETQDFASDNANEYRHICCMVEEEMTPLADSLTSLKQASLILL